MCVALNVVLILNHFQEQYIFLYEALVESFKDKHDVITKDNFIKTTRDLQNVSKPPPDWMKSQFEVSNEYKLKYCPL